MSKMPSLLLAVLLPLAVLAAETPARDEVVETQLLPRAVKQALRRVDLRGRPADSAAALRDAQRLIEAGRVSGDPRTLGYAQAVLAPWPAQRSDTPSDILVLHATIAQSRHDFGDARALLDRVLMREPAHAQARLTRATVALVSGDHALARSDCAALQALAPEAAAVCTAAVDAATGADAHALAPLRQIISRGGALRGWAAATLADVHAQRGEYALAARACAVALAHGDDANQRAVCADALLALDQPAQALQLLQHAAPTDGVLLRRWLALRALPASRESTAAAAALRVQLTERFGTAAARGELLHQREAAWFALEDGRAPDALALARANWTTQREAADLRVLARAARAARDTAALAEVRDWLRTTRLNDARVRDLLGDAA